MGEQDDWLWSLRVWVLILKSALEENNKDLARNSIKEVANIVSEISYIYNLWNGNEEIEQLEGSVRKK